MVNVFWRHLWIQIQTIRLFKKIVVKIYWMFSVCQVLFLSAWWILTYLPLQQLWEVGALLSCTLQMGKHMHRETYDLLRLVQLESGRAGIQNQSPHSQPGRYTKQSLGKRECHLFTGDMSIEKKIKVLTISLKTITKREFTVAPWQINILKSIVLPCTRCKYLEVKVKKNPILNNATII